MEYTYVLLNINKKNYYSSSVTKDNTKDYESTNKQTEDAYLPIQHIEEHDVSLYLTVIISLVLLRNNL